MGGEGGSGGGDGSSESSVSVRNTTDNRFWERLEKNIVDILAEATERDKATEAAAKSTVGGPEAGASAGGMLGLEDLLDAGKAQAEPASEKEQDREFRDAGVDVIINPEAGVVAIRATARQHETVAAYLAQVQDSVRRQVLIEATIVEVLLSQDYQAGIDWETFQNIGFEFIQTSPAFNETNVSTEPFFTATYLDGDLSATIQLLDEFGDTRVLSSPKLMALNNQTAVLKVVDNEVYFTIETDTQVNVNAPSLTTFDTTPNIVPVGLVMSVTPQIDGRDVVTLSVRPTISRVIDTVLDPNPALAEAGTTSEIPVIRIRELESVMMVNSGQIAVLGGLMQDANQAVDSGIPLLSDIPYLGEPFTYKSRDYQKSELVVFLRPTVMRQASLDGQLRDFRPYLEQKYQKRPRSRREGLGEIFDGLFPP